MDISSAKRTKYYVIFAAKINFMKEMANIGEYVEADIEQFRWEQDQIHALDVHSSIQGVVMGFKKMSALQYKLTSLLSNSLKFLITAIYMTTKLPKKQGKNNANCRI